jgi:hypothetical protein
LIQDFISSVQDCFQTVSHLVLWWKMLGDALDREGDPAKILGELVSQGRDAGFRYDDAMIAPRLETLRKPPKPSLVDQPGGDLAGGQNPDY